MWFILAAWVAGIAIGIERFFALRKADTDAPSLMNEIKKSVINNEVHTAITLCSNSPALLSRVMKAGLKRANQSRQQIQDIVEATIIESTGHAEKKLSFIALLANVSTLLGLLGTIQGLIVSFTAVTGADPAEKARLLADGISKAMNTTALGLISAISILFLHAYLAGIATKIMKEMDEYSMRLVDILGTKKNAEYKNDEAA